MTRIEVENGVELLVENWGSGTPIVFVHGWPLSHRMFEYQYIQLPREGIQCIGIDLRGYGQSSKPWSEYDFDMFADDLKNVLDELDLEDVVLAGFSMGGGVVTRYMGRHNGDHVGKVVMIGAASPVLAKKSDFPEGVDEDAFMDLAKGCYEDRAKVSSDFASSMFHSEPSPELKGWLQNMSMESSPQAMADSIEAVGEMDLRSDLADISVPTLICHSIHDQACPFELTAEKLHEGIENSELVRFEESEHALFYEEREKLNEKLVEFAQ
ncbi:proline iminopeptidase [Halalkalicoccus paucihalophilus]|uniref:Proline iminopeptidase n=1 Tax=Halalkalicoccus paucihalophilus TaxID=1008153 RepID=A0A151A955_9EURY|nr:alpha/beta hydrolase [Halalkalicoccus paucihalophilus]KYH24124.1 proline iminopeptidase [Halalkalicoccus paucihalophilus]